MRNLHPIAKVALVVAACFLFLWFFHPILNSPIDGSDGDEYELTVDEKIEVARKAGYKEGFEDGFDEGSVYGWEDRMGEVAEYFVDGATEYAISNSGMHPEEALYILDEGGTAEELSDAIGSLYYFYLYFYNSEYS